MSTQNVEIRRGTVGENGEHMEVGETYPVSPDFAEWLIQRKKARPVTDKVVRPPPAEVKNTATPAEVKSEPEPTEVKPAGAKATDPEPKAAAKPKPKRTRKR